MIIIVLWVDMINTLIREIVALSTTSKEDKTVAKINVVVFGVLGGVLIVALLLAILIACCIRREYYKKHSSFCFGHVLLLILQLFAALAYYLGDNAKDMLKNAKYLGCSESCPKFLEGFSLAFLVISLFVFQELPSIIQNIIVTIKNHCCCSEAAKEGAAEEGAAEKGAATEGKNYITELKIKKGKRPLVQMLPYFVKLDIFYTGLSIYSKVGDSCSIGVALMVIPILGSFQIIVNGVKTALKDSENLTKCDKGFVVTFLVLAVPVLWGYLLADNAHPLDCSFGCDPLCINKIRLVFIILTIVFVATYQCIYFVRYILMSIRETTQYERLPTKEIPAEEITAEEH